MKLDHLIVAKLSNCHLQLYMNTASNLHKMQYVFVRLERLVVTPRNVTNYSAPFCTRRSAQALAQHLLWPHRLVHGLADENVLHYATILVHLNYESRAGIYTPSPISNSARTKLIQLLLQADETMRHAHERAGLYSCCCPQKGL